MLSLEARRCGLQEVAPEHARVWLVDLEHPAPMPKEQGASLQIGFCERPEAVRAGVRAALYALLSIPFSARELGALLRRREPAATAELHWEGETVRLAGKRLNFSKTEQRVLTLLYENRARTVGVQEIEAILGEQAVKSNAVAVYLYRLRRKLEQDGVTRIRTVRGVGYRWIGE